MVLDFIKISTVAVVVMIAQFIVLPILMSVLSLQLVVLLVVIAVLRWGLVSALWLGAVVGIVGDVFGMSVFGVHGLWLVVTAVVAQIVSGRLVGSNLSMRVFVQMLVIFVSSFVGVVIDGSVLLGAFGSAGVSAVIGGVLIFKINAKE